MYMCFMDMHSIPYAEAYKNDVSLNFFFLFCSGISFAPIALMCTDVWLYGFGTMTKHI